MNRESVHESHEPLNLLGRFLLYFTERDPGDVRDEDFWSHDCGREDGLAHWSHTESVKNATNMMSEMGIP